MASGRASRSSGDGFTARLTRLRPGHRNSGAGVFAEVLCRGLPTAGTRT